MLGWMGAQERSRDPRWARVRGWVVGFGGGGGGGGGIPLPADGRLTAQARSPRFPSERSLTKGLRRTDREAGAHFAWVLRLGLGMGQKVSEPATRLPTYITPPTNLVNARVLPHSLALSRVVDSRPCPICSPLSQ